mgnify:CR=1 FL=1
MWSLWLGDGRSWDAFSLLVKGLRGHVGCKMRGLRATLGHLGSNLEGLGAQFDSNLEDRGEREKGILSVLPVTSFAGYLISAMKWLS